MNLQIARLFLFNPPPFLLARLTIALAAVTEAESNGLEQSVTTPPVRGTILRHRGSQRAAGVRTRSRLLDAPPHTILCTQIRPRTIEVRRSLAVTVYEL